GRQTRTGIPLGGSGPAGGQGGGGGGGDGGGGAEARAAGAVGEGEAALAQRRYAAAAVAGETPRRVARARTGGRGSPAAARPSARASSTPREILTAVSPLR